MASSDSDVSKRKTVIEILQASIETKKEMIDACTNDIIKAADLIAQCFTNGNKVLLCGNGGSAADAQHLSGEFVVRLRSDNTRKALPAIALTTDTSYLTAGANDFGFENVFVRGIEALGNKNDILLAISTSGNSPNIINAINQATKQKLTTIGLLGNKGGKALPLCSHSIVIPSTDTQRIQEAHITTGHIICELVENLLFG